MALMVEPSQAPFEEFSEDAVAPQIPSHHLSTHTDLICNGGEAPFFSEMTPPIPSHRPFIHTYRVEEKKEEQQGLSKGFYLAESVKYGKSLGVEDGSKNDGAQIIRYSGEYLDVLYDCNGNQRQVLKRAAEQPAVAIKHELKMNESLEAGEQILSPNGKYKAIMQHDGNFVVKAGNLALWATNTNDKGSGPFQCTMQEDGNLVVYCGNGKDTWASNTCRQGCEGARCAMQDDGNLVISLKGKAMWASHTDGGKNANTWGK